MVKIAVILEGGLISKVLTDSPDIEIITMDEDIEGLDSSEVTIIAGKQLFAQRLKAETDKNLLEQIFRDFDKEEPKK